MRKYIFLLLITLSSQWFFAQVQFEAKTSKMTVALNERLRVDFIMNQDGDNFEPPVFDGFKIVGGPSQSVNYSWINGKKSYSKTYSYFLMPMQKGSVIIKQASIEIENQIYKTTPIKITVTGATEQIKDTENSNYTPEGAIYLVADVSKTTPYINEPITVVYKMYFKDVGIRNWKELDVPKYNDFWSQSIDIKELVAEEGIYNGEKYRYVVLRKTILYPQKSGKLTVEPLTLDVTLEIPSNRRDIFGNYIMSSANKTITSGTKNIQVKPLPEEGKPIGFTGAVGKFDFKVKASKTSLKYGESLELDVIVSGKGNLKLFNLPQPIVSQALEMYEPVHNEKVNTSLNGSHGEVNDKYTIIPEYKGDYTIKPMRFSYFDLTDNSYKTITSQEIMIHVLDGPISSGVSQTNSDINNNIEKQQVIAGEQFRFIKLKTKLKSIKETDYFNSKLFYTLLFAPFLMILILVLAKRKREAVASDIIGNKIKESNKLAKKYLSEAKKQINNNDLFYIALEKAMHNFLKAKLNIETSEMTKDKIKTLLASRNARQETIESFISLTENCEFARYSPFSQGAILDDYDKAIRIISMLEKQL